MQHVSQNWLATNAAAFRNESNVGITIYHADGQTFLLNDELILKVKHEVVGDIFTGSIPSFKITAELSNKTGVFDYNPESDTYKNNEVLFRYGFKFQDGDISGFSTIDGGRLFISESSYDEDAQKLIITCNDIIAFMTETYTGIKSGTAYEIAVAAIEQAASSTIVPLSEIQYYLDQEAMQECEINIPVGKAYSIRDVLQLCANGSMCIMYCDRRSAIHIEQLTDFSGEVVADPPEQLYLISRKIQYSNVKAQIDKRINRVEFYYQTGWGYSDLDNESGQTQVMENELVANDNESSLHLNNCITWVYYSLRYGRVVYSGQFRVDPRLDLFDIVYVETKQGTKPCVITQLSMEYNGGWTGNFTARSVNISDNITDIYSLEQLTIYDLESHTIEELEGGGGIPDNTISTIGGDLLTTADWKYLLYEEGK